MSRERKFTPTEVTITPTNLEISDADKAKLSVEQALASAIPDDQARARIAEDYLNFIHQEHKDRQETALTDKTKLFNPEHFSLNTFIAKTLGARMVPFYQPKQDQQSPVKLAKGSLTTKKTNASQQLVDTSQRLRQDITAANIALQLKQKPLEEIAVLYLAPDIELEKYYKLINF